MMFRDDEYYIGQVLGGHREAFRSIVEKHQDFVYTIVHRIVNAPVEAEEIAQDVFVKAYTNLAGFRGKASFSTWLYRIAYNEAISHTRKRKIEFPAIDEYMMLNHAEEEVMEDINGLAPEEQRQLIHKAMAVLPATDSLIITLFYFHEKDMAEIGEIVNMSTNNVKVKLHRIRKCLLQEMNNILEMGSVENDNKRII